MPRKRKKQIDKRVTLVRLKANRFGVEFIVNEFDTVGYLDGNHSLEIDDYNYYCKNDKYFSHVAKGYVFIVDQEYRQKALENFIKEINMNFDGRIKQSEETTKSLIALKDEVNLKSDKIK